MDSSLYERSHQGRSYLSNGQALGRIVSVDIEKRLCRVKTYHGPQHLIDLDCNNVQWIDQDTNGQGDESTSIPREGALCVVVFIEGEAFVHGYINALSDGSGAVTGNETAALVRGDKIISTKAGNRIIIRANGALEFISKATLKTTFIPTDSRIITLCKNFNFKSDGGFIDWQGDDVGQTLHAAEYRANILRSSVMLEKRGNVSAATIYTREIGPGVPGTPGIPAALYKKEYGIDGSTKETVGPAVPTRTTEMAVDGSIKHDMFGDYSILSKLGKFLVELDTGDAKVIAKLGSIMLEATAGKVDLKSLQDMSFTSDTGNVSVKATAKDVNIEGSQAKMKLGKGKVALGGPTAELLDLFDQLLDAMKDAWTAAAAETHIGNMGYPTAPPTNAADYVKAAATVTQIKTLLGTIKGSL